MTSWTEDELSALNRLDEIRVAGRRTDGSLRRLTIIWHVIVDNKMYVRSVRGVAGGWYKGIIQHHEGVVEWNAQTRAVAYIPDSSADDQVDAAYFAKYGPGPDTVAITNAAATATTMRVEPLGPLRR